MKQRRDRHTVAGAGDSSRHSAGVLDVTTAEPRRETIEQLCGEPLSLFRRDHRVAPGHNRA